MIFGQFLSANGGKGLTTNKTCFNFSITIFYYYIISLNDNLWFTIDIRNYASGWCNEAKDGTEKNAPNYVTI